MKKKLIGGIIATLLLISLLIGNIVVKSTKEVKAGVYPIACASIGFCFMEDGWFLYDAIYLPPGFDPQ